MTISVQVLQDNLKAALAAVSPAIPARPTLPSLTHIRLKTVNGSLAISATDLDLAITATASAKVVEEGEILVPGHEFIRQVDALPSAIISLTTEGKKVTIRCESAETKMATIDVADWPKLPTLDDTVAVSVPSPDLRAALSRALIAVAKDDSRPVLTAINTYTNHDGNLELVSADGFQASIARVKPGSVGLPLEPTLVPGASAKALLTAVRGAAADSPITIHRVDRVDGTRASRFIGFRCEKVEVVSVLVEATYPDVYRLLPAEFMTTARVPRVALTRAIRLAALTSKEVMFHIGENDIRVSTETAETKHSNDIGFCEVTGQPMAIRINADYMTDLFPQFDGENVALKFIGPNQQMVATDGDGRDYWQVVTAPLFESVQAKREAGA